MALGRLLTEARLRGDERALVIGAATGYSAAVLARLVGIGDRARGGCRSSPPSPREALAGTGVELVKGPLAQGHAAGAPYDFILIDGAVEHVPPAIVDQVADGGEIALACSRTG